MGICVGSRPASAFSLAGESASSPELVIPSFTPSERGIHEVGEVGATEQVIKRPSGGGMPDDEDLPILEGRNQVGEEGFDSPDDLSIALAFRKRLINAPPPLCLQ